MVFLRLLLTVVLTVGVNGLKVGLAEGVKGNRTSGAMAIFFGVTVILRPRSVISDWKEVISTSLMIFGSRQKLVSSRSMPKFVTLLSFVKSEY